MTSLTFISFNGEINAYGQPVVNVKSDKDLRIINRGWNVFESTDKIDLSALDIKNFCTHEMYIDKWPTYKCQVRIHQPSGKISHADYTWQHKKGVGYDEIYNELDF